MFTTQERVEILSLFYNNSNCAKATARSELHTAAIIWLNSAKCKIHKIENDRNELYTYTNLY